MREVRPVSGADVLGAGALGDALRDAVRGDGPAVLPVEPGEPVAPELLATVDDDVAVLVRTTGSTGEPKAVLLPGAALRASVEATHTRLGGPGRWLLALPAHHVAGVQVLLRSALAGRPAAVAPVSDGFRPEALAGHDVAYTSLVPTQLRRAVAEGGAGLEALRAMRAVLVGGAAADPALLARARSLGVRVVATYGMSETCGGCVYDGRPLDGVSVAIGADGVVRLGGATVARGYRGVGSAAFADGWFTTSDLGRWAPDGRLEILGRADDVIVSGGENVAPVLVERALLGVDGVHEACVVGLPDPEWGRRVVAAVVGVAGLDGEAVRAAVRPSLGRATPQTVAVLDALPTIGIGKIDREALRACAHFRRL